MSSRRSRRWWNLLFLLLGIGLLVGLLFRLDAEQVVDRLLQAGLMLVPAFGAYVGSLVCSTLAWDQTIDRADSSARFHHLLAAFWAGHAINGVTPGAAMGEVLKGSILLGRVDGEEVVASIVLYTFLTAAVTLGFTVLGPLLCLGLLDMPVAVLATLFGTAAVVCVAIVAFALLLRRGLARQVVRVVARLPIVKLRDPDKLLARAESVDERIGRFRHRRPAAFRKAVLFIVAARVFLTLELACFLVALLPERSLPWVVLVAMLLQSASQLVAWVGAVVPGRVGLQEGGAALLFQLVGLDPVAGFSAALLRRVRKVVGISIGLAIGAVMEGRGVNRRGSQPAPAPPREVEP